VPVLYPQLKVGGFRAIVSQPSERYLLFMLCDASISSLCHFPLFCSQNSICTLRKLLQYGSSVLRKLDVCLYSFIYNPKRGVEITKKISVWPLFLCSSGYIVILCILFMANKFDIGGNNDTMG